MNIITSTKKTEKTLTILLFLGIFFLFSGMLILQKTSHYQTVFYILVLGPSIVITMISPRKSITNLSNITKIFIIFSIWSSISILWSDTQENIFTVIKRSVYILSLFLAFSILSREKTNNIIKIMIASGITISFISVYSLFEFQNSHTTDRLVGEGALTNPLLSSHIYGFFLVFFLCLGIMSDNFKNKTAYLICTIILLITVLATGSRTPILALATTLIWVAFILKNKKSIIIITSSIITLTIIYFTSPETFLNRGLSYRPELWSIAIEKIKSQPVLGYGFDSSIGFHIDSLDITFREPHNIHLSIFFFTGIIGFALWGAMHVYALWMCWKNKEDSLFLIASALLVYGIAAGMTEGGGLLPRPKEHWFITWIPLAFVSALLTHKTSKTKESIAERT